MRRRLIPLVEEKESHSLGRGEGVSFPCERRMTLLPLGEERESPSLGRGEGVSFPWEREGVSFPLEMRRSLLPLGEEREDPSLERGEWVSFLRTMSFLRTSSGALGPETHSDGPKIVSGPLMVHIRVNVPIISYN